MSRKSKKKKESVFIKLANAVFTIILAAIMAYGLQCYSATSHNTKFLDSIFSNKSNSLKFAQISDVHFYTGDDNTTYKLRAESGRLFDDAVSQVNETAGLDFVMFTGDQIDKSFEKELRAFLPHAQNHVP